MIRDLIHGIIAFLLGAIAPADTRDCICRIRGRWHDRAGRPGFRPSEWS